MKMTLLIGIGIYCIMAYIASIILLIWFIKHDEEKALMYRPIAPYFIAGSPFIFPIVALILIKDYIKGLIWK